MKVGLKRCGLLWNERKTSVTSGSAIAHKLRVAPSLSLQFFVSSQTFFISKITKDHPHSLIVPIRSTLMHFFFNKHALQVIYLLILLLYARGEVAQVGAHTVSLGVTKNIPKNKQNKINV